MVAEGATSSSVVLPDRCGSRSAAAARASCEDTRDDADARDDADDEARDTDEEREEGALGDDGRANNVPDEERGEESSSGSTATTTTASSKEDVADDGDADWEEDATLPAGVMTETHDSVRSGGGSPPPADGAAITRGDGPGLRGAPEGGTHTPMSAATCSMDFVG